MTSSHASKRNMNWHVQIMSYYDNYIKEISKVALFTAEGEFFASVLFIEHKLSDFPGPTWEQKQQQRAGETFRPKGKSWKFRIHFAARSEVDDPQFFQSTPINYRNYLPSRFGPCTGHALNTFLFSIFFILSYISNLCLCLCYRLCGWYKHNRIYYSCILIIMGLNVSHHWLICRYTTSPSPSVMTGRW